MGASGGRKTHGSEFVCNLKFRNEIPEVGVDPKLLKIPIDLAKYTQSRIYSNEQEMVIENRSHAKADIVRTCPTDIIYHSIVDVVQRSPLDPADEELCTGRGAVSRSGHTDSSAPASPKKSPHSRVANEPGKKAYSGTIETQDDLINAIAETFEPCEEFVHPKNPSLSAVKVYSLLPDPNPHELAQCNFDGQAESDEVILRGTMDGDARCFDYYAGVNGEYKYIREYAYQSYAEEGNTLVLSLGEDHRSAFYSLVNAKVNLRKRRPGAQSVDKRPRSLVVNRE